MRRQLLDTCLLCRVLHDMADYLFRDPFSPDRAGTIHTSEQPPVRDGCGADPFVQSRFNPIGNRNRSDLSTLNGPMEEKPTFRQVARNLVYASARAISSYACSRYLLVSAAARNRSSGSTSAGSATVSAISWRKSSRYLLRSL